MGAVAFGIFVYCVSGAILGALGAFVFDFDWACFTLRCPTYGELLLYICLGACAGLLLAVYLGPYLIANWFFTRPCIRRVMNKPVCGKRS